MNDKNNFQFKKKFGQNFLSDKNLLASLIKLTPLTKEDNVLEIGLGKGALTQILSENAKKVVGYEIDLDLKEHLEEKFNGTNVNLVFKDGLKEDIKQIENQFDGKKFAVVANIPYYITTPLIFKFLEETAKVNFMALMIQKEVAERIIAPVGDENYGALSVICQFHNTCKILKIVNKKMFFPVPKVDSAFIFLSRTKDFDFEYARLVRTSFNMRRKTLINNLMHGFGLDREFLNNVFASLGFDLNARAENLSPQDFFVLLQQIKTYLPK